MKLVNLEYHLELQMKENQVNVLVIEPAEVFAHIIMEIFGQIQGKEGTFVLSDRDKIKILSKESELILHPFELDCNERKIQQKLYQLLSVVAEEELTSGTVEVNAQIVSYLDALLDRIPYGLTFEPDMNLTGLLKLYAVRVDCASEGLLGQIMDYLRALQSFCHIAVIFFVNLKTFLGKEELLRLYEFVFYQKIQLILLENVQREPLQGENICILDKDMCIIEV